MVVLTFILFVVALFTKGFTQGLLLETGVFLVSVKLIIMGLKNAVTVEAIMEKLDQIIAEENRIKKLMQNPNR